MRIWIFSDLHLNIWREHAEMPMPELVVPENIDACVVPGDLEHGVAMSIQWLAENLPKDLPIIFVAGNHEHYLQRYWLNMDAGRDEAAKHLNIHFLENEVVEIAGVRFVGATLWTDFRVEGDEALSKLVCFRGMNDYKLIYRDDHGYEAIAPSFTHQLHLDSRVFLRDTLNMPFDGETVVVTHHAPHPQSIHPRYHGNPLNGGFVSDLTSLISAFQPALWIHGHTHDRFDYQLGETRVVCNPLGYHHEAEGFNPALVIDTERL